MIFYKEYYLSRIVKMENHAQLNGFIFDTWNKYGIKQRQVRNED